VRGLYLFCFLFFIPILVAMIREPRQPVYWLILLPVFFALGPLVQNSLFYAGMNPNFSDFAKCGEITLTLFFLAFLLMILRRNLWHALAFGLLTASIRWYGVFLIAIHFIVFALFIKELRRPLVIFIICVSALTLTAILIGVAGGYFEGWLETFRDEHLRMIVNTSALTTEAGFVVLHYSIFAGLLTPVLFLSWYRKQKFNLGLALGCIAYLIFTMMSSLYLNHFLVPIVLIPLVVLGRLLNTVEKRRIVVAVSSLALILQLTTTWVLFPTKIPLHTAGRDLGRQTCILTDSFEEAIRLAQVLEYVELGPSQWISYQT